MISNGCKPPNANQKIILRGPQGPPGPMGPMGPTGPQGPSGSAPSGTRGSFVVLDGAGGTVSTANVFISTSNTIGLGTTSPAANLHVIGNIYASNALQTTNIFSTSLNVTSISNLNSVVTPSANITTLNVTSISNLNSVVTPSANITTLNVTSISNLNTLVLRNNIFASNAITTTNIIASNVTTTGRLEADSTWILGVSGTTQRNFRTGRVTGLSVSNTVQDTATITFGYTAASTAYRVIATTDGGTSGFPFTASVCNKTTTTFDVRVVKFLNSGTSTVAVDWILIE